MVHKLCLRQEDQLNQMALDRSFLVFFQAGKGSILPAMILVEWRAKTVSWSDMPSQTGSLSESGRRDHSTLVHGKVKFDDPADPLVNGLKQKQILTAAQDWNYLSWDGSAKCLRPTKQAPIKAARLQEMMIELSQLAAQTDL